MSNDEVPPNSYIALQQEIANLRSQVAELQEAAIFYPDSLVQQKALLSVVTKINKSLDLDTIFTTTAREIRQILYADRVGIYRFKSGVG